MNYIELAQAHVAERYPYLIYPKDPIPEIPTGAIMGTWAISVAHKYRIILNPKMEIAPGVMPSDLSRAWIKDQFKLPIRLRKAQLANKSYPLPIMARVGKWTDCSYVDIRKAYLTILRLGYDVEYEANKYVGANFTHVPNEIAENKLSYSVAIAMSNSRQTNISIMGKDGPFSHKAYNVYSNPCLYNLACDTLSSIASEATRLFGDKLHYINTDGYIVDTEYADDLISVINSWGFDARVKFRGRTQVFRVGAWWIEGNHTKWMPDDGTDWIPLLPSRDESLWLKQRLYKLNNRATII